MTFAKHQIIIFSLLYFSGICNDVHSQNVTDANGLKQGTWIKKDDAGNIKYKGQFKDNAPFGTFHYFHSNGKPKAISEYFDSGKKTHTIMFSVDGIKEAEGNFLNQMKDSIWLYYDLEGKNVLSQESYHNNLRDGKFINYYKSNNIQEIIEYKNGKKNGYWKLYYEDSKPRIIAKYVNGELDSAYNVFFADGTKMIEGYYRNATKDGNWFYYNSTGSVNRQEMFKDSKLVKKVYFNGTFTTYFSDEIPKEIFTYIDGKLDGKYIEYYNNGTFIKKQKTNDDNSSDTVETLVGQTIKCEGIYKSGKKIGKFFYYNEKGKLLKEE